jgi:hypothetical protein
MVAGSNPVAGTKIAIQIWLGAVDDADGMLPMHSQATEHSRRSGEA